MVWTFPQTFHIKKEREKNSTLSEVLVSSSSVGFMLGEGTKSLNKIGYSCKKSHTNFDLKILGVRQIKPDNQVQKI